MNAVLDTKSKYRPPAKLAAGLAIATVLLFGTFVVAASADERHDDRRGGEHRGDGGRDGDRGGGRGGDWGGGRGGDWGGRGYYSAPPVVYGNPGYYPPPVVYGPAVGVYLPGVSIGIR
jgi:hypothetical protein